MKRDFLIVIFLVCCGACAQHTVLSKQRAIEIAWCCPDEMAGEMQNFLHMSGNNYTRRGRGENVAQAKKTRRTAGFLLV
jgi:hypothetical protein